MSFETIVIFMQVLGLILLSAFFSGSETALTAASRARMHSLEGEGDPRAKRVNAILAQPERMIGTILLGNNLVNILASALATSLAISLFGKVGVAYATIAMTILVVIFAEVMPKSYALAFPNQIALAIAPVMQAVIFALRPAVMVVEFIVRQLFKLTPSERDDESNILAAHQEIRGTIDLQTREGAVARHDADMLGGVLDLKDLQVADIMVHRTKMETINADDPIEKTVQNLLSSQYTRVPIWKDEPENIVGILHTKDLFAALGRQSWDLSKVDIMSFAPEPWFVPETTSLKDQLNAFLKVKAQLALVVDEYGEVQGLITLEDILEEIVGQIDDEHDFHAAQIRPQIDGTVNVDGAVHIRDLNRSMKWDLPDVEATTVAGLVIHEAQTIPEPGQVFTFYGYRFEILRKSRNKIAAMRVERLANGEPAVEQSQADAT